MYGKRANDYIMVQKFRRTGPSDHCRFPCQAHGIAKATGHTDTSTPKVAWGHRKQRDAYRATKFTDPVYVNTGGYEVQWSQQEAIVARRYMDMHERAINTKSYVNTRVNPAVIHFREWRNRQRAAIAAPISVPMGDLYAEKEANKKARQQRRAEKAAKEGGGISKQSQLLLDQMASRVLQSAMSAATNDKVRSNLVKAMQNPSLNPLKGQGYNPDKDAPQETETRAMYKCDVITGFKARNELELTLREGEVVFILQDDKQGFFLGMDEKGNCGSIPSSCVHFKEAVSRVQFPSQEYSLGHGNPIPGGANVSRGNFGETAGRVDHSRAMTAPPAKRVGVMGKVEKLAEKLGEEVPQELYRPATAAAKA